MANVTPTTAAPFIPEIWAGKALGRVAGNLVIAGVARRDWQNVAGGIGDTINIQMRGAITVAAKTPGTPVTPQAPSDSLIPVVLDSHYVAAFQVEDIVRAEENQDTGGGYIEDAAVALAEQIEVSGLTTAYTGFTTNTALGTAGTDAGEALVRSIRKTLADAKVDQATKKYVFWSTKDASALLGLARFSDANVVGDQGTTLREATLGKWMGLQHIESQYVVTTGSAPVDTHCVAFAPDALTLAMRPLKEPKAPGAVSSVVNIAGLGLRTTLSYNGLEMADLMTIDALWGWAVVRNAFGVHVHT